MNSKFNITQLTVGQEITINKHGEIIKTTFKGYRELTVRTRTATFDIRTGVGIISAGLHGEAVHYNDYSTFIVSVETPAETMGDLNTQMATMLELRKSVNAEIKALQKKIRKAQQVKPITITEVVLDRAEGPTELCKEHKFEGVSALATANQTLKDWAADMDEDRLGYDKVDFTLFLSNGDSYEGRFDMKPSHRANANLIDHIVSHLEWVVENGEMIGAEHTKVAVNALPLYRSFR